MTTTQTTRSLLRLLATRCLPLAAASALALAQPFCLSAFSAAAPVKLILDTDMGNDVDDALALAVIHALQSRGVCELLAVTHTSAFPDISPGTYTTAINTFYGRPGIPVGVTPDAPRAEKESKYLKVALQRGTDGQPLYPAKFDPATAPLSVDLLRRTLAAADDNSIVIVQVGFSTNLARLLASPPDAASPLPGMELVRRKVRLLSIMAGNFSPVPAGKSAHVEYNVKWDIPAARKLAADWPTPILWSDFIVGRAVPYPAWSIDHDFAYTPHHIIKDSYQAYRPTPHERPCWDPTSVIAAVWPERGYFAQVKGRVSIDENGVSTFAPDKHGRDVLLKVNKTQIARLRELLAALASEPPKK